jgi:transmembrane protein 33
MRAVAYAELAIMVRVLLGAVTFQNSLLCPIIYAHFLRQRYYQSAFTRDAVGNAVHKIDDTVANFQKPVVTDVWVKAKVLVARWAGTTLQPQPAAAAR